MAALLKLEVPLIVQIGERSLSLREVLALAPGSLIELDKPAEDDLEVMIHDREIGSGRAVKVGENYGVRMVRTGHALARAVKPEGAEQAAP